MIIALLGLGTIIFGDFIYDLKYNRGHNSYTVSYGDYKDVQDFRQELLERGLMFDKMNEDLLDKLSKTDYINRNIKSLSYKKASFNYLYNDYFFEYKENDIETLDISKKAPVYMYDSILFLIDRNSKLEYMPITKPIWINSSFDGKIEKFTGYYIECKILYVDDDVYALIGSPNYEVGKYFSEYEKDVWDVHKYNVILSKKDTITTYFNDKYYPDGGIENHGLSFKMIPNTREKPLTTNFPVRKVDKLDINTINDVAKELQDGLLKGSIDYFFNNY